MALGRGCVALPPARGVAGNLDLRNPVVLHPKNLFGLFLTSKGYFDFLGYHAVGNYYLKYSWEYFMQKIMHNIVLYCGQSEYFR